MPAEGIHLSALHDSLMRSAAPLRQMLGDGPLREAARLGASLVDLPYFDGLAMGVVRYLLRLMPQGSRWGDVFHHRAPIALGRTLGELGVHLQRRAASAETGRLLRALSIGYISHAAVDTSMHPMVNRLARERAAARNDTPTRQHMEVEKFQSILFHEERLGFDFMGMQALQDYIRLDGKLLVFEPLCRAIIAAMEQTLGEAPRAVDFARWFKGYRDYARLIASPIGKTVAPPSEKARERPALYDALNFPGCFEEAMLKSRRWIDVLHRYLDDGSFDESARAAFLREIPEGSIDPGAPGVANS